MESKTIIPFVSIIMPIYNGNQFVKAAIESILKQTYTNFEFIIIDDGSTDESAKTIETFTDGRIVFIQNKVNKGLVYSLNKAIKIARGKYIARMDADDISLPNRVLKQVNFLEKNQHYALVGTNIRFIIKGKVAQAMYLPNNNESAKCRLLFNTTFVHPSVMIVTDILKKYSYDNHFYPAEDYHLWTRIAANHPVTNLDEILVHCRIHDNNIHLNTREEVLESIGNIYKNVFSQTFDYQLTDKIVDIHQCLCLYKRDFTEVKQEAIEDWIEDLKELNKTKNVFSSKVFNQQLSQIWINYIYNYVRYGKQNINIFKSKLIFYIPFIMIIKTLIYMGLNFLNINKNA